MFITRMSSMKSVPRSQGSRIISLSFLYESISVLNGVVRLVWLGQKGLLAPHGMAWVNEDVVMLVGGCEGLSD